MKYKKAYITKTRHKSQPYVLTIDERLDTVVKKRYSTAWRAAIGAVRKFGKSHLVEITHPDGRKQTGYVSQYVGVILAPLPRKKK